MTIYLILAILFTLVGYEMFSPFSTDNKWKFIAVWFVLSIFWGFSYIYAPDIPGYMKYFDYKVYDWFKDGIRLPAITFEKGFNILSCILKSLVKQYYIYQFILFSVELFLVMIGLKRLLNIDKAIILICALFFILPMNLLGALRQGIAISLFIFAIPYILERNMIKYGLVIILASFFHQSSLFLLFLYWIPLLFPLLRKKNILICLLVLLNLCYFLGFSISNIIDTFLLSSFTLYDGLDTYTRYVNSESRLISNFGIAKIIEMNFVYVLFILMNKNQSNYYELLKIMFLVYFILNMLLGGILAHRIGYYFVIVYNVSLIISMCLFAKQYMGKKENGYLLVCAYYIFLYLFYFNDFFSNSMVYRNLFLEHVFC